MATKKNSALSQDEQDSTVSLGANTNEACSSAKCENEVKKGNNCDQNGGSITPCSTPSFVDDEEEEDSKSCCSSGKDSGVGKSGTSDPGSGRDSGLDGRNSTSGGGDTDTVKTITTSGGVSSSGKSSKFARSTSASEFSDLDSSPTFLWGASLLYYTGIPTPKVKEHHFLASPTETQTPPQRLSSSNSSSTFSLFKRKSSKLFRSTLSLRGLPSATTEEESEQSMDNSNYQPNRTPWRFGGAPAAPSNRKKFNTLPVKTKSPFLVDSTTPLKPSGSSTLMSTPDSGFLSGTGGESTEVGGGRKFFSQQISPLRRRHANCTSSSSELTSTPTNSNTTGGGSGGGGMMGNLRGRIKNNANSLRLFKRETTSRPPIPDFMEKSSSNSLPRSPRKQRICEENLAAQGQQASNEEYTATSSSSSSLGLKSAKKALRNSFKAARNLLPGSLSKIGPASGSTGKTSLKSYSSKEKLSTFPSGDGPTDATSSTLNSSAPNTPVVIKKSRLERARKKFASTLSLHTGSSSSSGGGGSSSNNDNSYASGGGGVCRSKSTSTLIISDTEAASSVPYGVVSYSNHHNQNADDAASFSPEENLDTLAVIDQEASYKVVQGPVTSSGGGVKEKKEGSKSPFRFIGRSKGNKEKKSGTTSSSSHPQGFVEIQRNEKANESEQSSHSPAAEGNNAMEVHFKNTGKHATADVVMVGEKEKPSKGKRMSLVKSFIDKTIHRGSSSSKQADGGSNTNKEDINSGDTSGGTKKESVIFYKTSGGSVSSSVDLETKRRRSGSTGSSGGGRRGLQQQHEDSQEIVTFEDEPRVRTPKAGRRQRLNSGSGTSGNTTASSSVTCTPPPLPLSPPPSSSSSITPPSSSSTHEKDREIQELEVSETSIDISPVKIKHQLHHQLAHYDVDVIINKSKNNDRESREQVVKVVSGESSSGSSKLKKSGSSTTSTPQKKTKSQSLINSLISLSPSASFSVGKKNMDQQDGSASSKKKKKNSKKVNNNNKKTEAASAGSQETTTTTTTTQNAAGDQSSAVQQVNEENVLKAADESTQSHNQQSSENNNDFSTSSTTPSGERRRKSSDVFKDLRKNGVHSNTQANELDESVAVSPTETVPPENVTRRQDVVGGITDDEKEKDATNPAENNEVDETDDGETACTESFRQLKPFNYDLEPVEEGKKERLYKVLVVGELGAGKTSIIKRYVHQFFSQHYRATIGVDFALKVLRWDPDTVVRLQLWDIAGQERFGSMTRVYYKEAVGAFVVFDVTRSATLEAVPKWKADLDAKVALPDGRPIPTVLLANKSDQQKEGIAASREKMNEFCQQQGFSAWFETSAKDNINIDESANFLVSKILEMDKWSQEPLAPDPDKVELTANGKHKGSSSSNCAC